MLAWTPVAGAGVTVTPIAQSAHGDQFGPDVEGARVVYTNNAGGDNDVYLYDVNTKIRKRLTFGFGSQSRPKISGDNIVYLDSKSGVPQLRCYTISTGQSRALNAKSPSVLEHAVDGDTVALIAPTTNPNEYAVKTLSLSTGLVRTIRTYQRSRAPYSLGLAGAYLAYSVYPEDEDDDSGRMSLYVTHLRTGITRAVDNGDHACVTASGTVVYTQSYGDLDPTFVKSYDAVTKTISTVSTGWAEPLDISAGRLLYCDSQNGLWVRHLDAGTRIKIASSKPIHSHGTAQMSGTRVVWDDTRYSAENGFVWPPGTPGHWMDYDVYSATYNTPLFSLACPKGVTYGKRATITGKISTKLGALYVGRVSLQRSTDKKHWTTVTSKSTSTSGTFAMTSREVRRATYFRVKFVKGSLRVNSYFIKILPRALVSRPPIPSEVATDQAVTLKGTVRPAQTKTSELMVVGGRKAADGTWEESELGAKVYAPVAHSGYSTYKVRLPGLSKPGEWRVRIRARDIRKGVSWGVSPYEYFTVK